MIYLLQQIDQLNQSQKEQIQRLREHHEEQQQLTDEINRAVMFQRMQQISRTGAQMGMVSDRLQCIEFLTLNKITLLEQFITFNQE